MISARLKVVMFGLDPAIYARATGIGGIGDLWMRGSSPRMTTLTP
jgi:hypothetical protein